MNHILDKTLQELSEYMVSIGEPAYRGKQIYQWIFHKRIQSFEQMTNVSKKLREKLEQDFVLHTFRHEDQLVSHECATRKYLFRTHDGHYIESVLIPDGERKTLCISSQVGCSLGCAFCATGMMGYYRNLTAGEILEQIIQAEYLSGERITNIVFMGMGEPFLNFPRVIQAAQVMADPEGFAIRRRRITISTSGIVPKIRQLADENQPVGLAVSLHAPNQQIREQLMPIAKKYSYDELMESIRYYTRKTRKRVTFEYILIEGINDEEKHARELIGRLAGIPSKINLIPYNDVGAGFRAPDETRINRFIQVLLSSPVTVTLRKSRGHDIQAACGQLSTRYMMEHRDD